MYIPSFSEQLQASRSHGAMSKAPPLWRGCVGLWPLSEGGGGTAFDLARNNHGGWNGTGPTHHVVSKYGRCGKFNGTDDYVDAGNSASINNTFGNSSFTVSLWLKLPPVEHIDIWNKGGSDKDFGSWCRLIIVFNKIQLEIDDGSTKSSNGSATSIDDDTWHHVTAVRDSGRNKLRVYEDGVEVIEFMDSSGDITVNENFHIGHATDRGWFNGLISNATIHDRALLPSEIQQLYADPHCMTTIRRPVTTVVMGGGVSGVTVSVATGAVIATGNNATVTAGTTISASLGTATATGYNASVSAGTDVSVALGTSSVTGYAATVSAGTTIAASLGSVAATANNATVSAGTTVSASLGTVSITGNAASISPETAITATLCTVVAAALNATVEATVSVPVTRGAITVASYSASITVTVGATADGMDYAAADGRPHFTAGQRPHFHAGDNRPHFTVT